VIAASPLCLHAVALTPAGLMEPIRSYYSISFGLPQLHGGSAPALIVSRPAQRLLTLRPACSPSRLSDPLHRRLRRLRFLRRRSDCYRVERTSSRAGLSPAVNQRLSRRTCNQDLTPVIVLAKECHSSTISSDSRRSVLRWLSPPLPMRAPPTSVLARSDGRSTCVQPARIRLNPQS
jgi:hypothetical protein